MTRDTAMLLATVGLVVVSATATVFSFFLLRSQVDPEVNVYVKHDEMRPSLLTNVIENIGKGVAHNIRFTLGGAVPQKAWGVESPSKGESVQPMTKGPLATGIPLLAPGDRRVLNWGQYGGLLDALGPLRFA